MNPDFDDFLTNKTDAIYDAAHKLLCAIAAKDSNYPDDVLDWDMSLLGPLADYAEQLLKDNGHTTCFPYFDENEDPCVTCGVCTNPNCVLK